ncbi:Cytochrome b5-like heme/steroid binding domain protein [Kalmanozyma brasiliensis GHG001]|uniref:Cytochrome b5-like heme/steroid binding domain protein n=1 Tax=Kalmanozyma brasiliensis (strain GHG001) TaxID=1365824 RepID=UPI00286814EF|nr:Cytochrome b5-like heme/steroid binding domain protein [Kalmanozyma brasiliensis GHG001]EST05048.2 Cytochrome b5-like heme/steroid binding domain protein [Kalmanozyma brasiliensis GHG001]
MSAANPAAEEVDKLSQLLNITPETIFSVLRDRFYSGLPYTALSDSILVSVNPYASSGNRNSDDTLREYTRDHRETNKQLRGAALPPHIFAHACNAYFYMRRTGQDQSLLMAGDTSSGKSEVRRLAIRALIDLSVAAPGKKGAKLGVQVPSAEYILEALGNSRTLENSNASRFGKYTELQFSDSGKLVGAKTLDYYLEKNRVVSAASSERNFHVFHYMVAGASDEEKQYLGIHDAASFRYLGQASHIRDADDAAKFNRLKLAFKNVGFSKRHVASICQVLAAILHLGNIEFHYDSHRTQDSATVRNPEVLDKVAEYLGIPSKSLEEALTYKTKLIRNEVCTILLDADGASDHRDDLAKSLYSLLFAWVNESLNEKLCRDDFDTFIGLLGLPGFQNMSRGNSLDQFCVNFACENLHRFMLRSVFEKRRDEFADEAIEHLSPEIPYFDNAETAVTYTSENLLEKNSEVVSPDFVSLLRGSPQEAGKLGSDPNASTGSSIPFVRGIFNTKVLKTQSHPKNDQTIVAAQQSVRPIRAPSTRRPNRGNTVKRSATVKKGDNADDDSEDDAADAGDASTSKKTGVRCVAGDFRGAFDLLLETLEETKTWFTLCIRPNDNQLPNQFEARAVKHQITTLGLSEMSRKLLHEYSVSMTYEEFCQRYADTPSLQAVQMRDAVSGEAKQKFSAAREVMSWSDEEAASGRVKVFLSHTAFRELEDELRAADPEEVKNNERRAQLDADTAARGESDPFSPLAVLSPDLPRSRSNDFVGAYGDPFKDRSSVALPLVGGGLAEHDDMLEEVKSQYSGMTGTMPRRSFGGPLSGGASVIGSEAYAPSRNMFADMGKNGLNEKAGTAAFTEEPLGEVAEEIGVSSTRRKWVAFTWAITFFVPSFILRRFRSLQRPDIRMAWREKLAINLIIWFICGCAVFVIVVLGNLICPKQHVYSPNEFATHKGDSSFTSIRGEVFDLSNLVASHKSVVPVVPANSILAYAGEDATGIFPVQVNALCNGVDGNVSPWVQLSNENSTDKNAQYHDFRSYHTDDARPDWYYETMWLLRSNYRVGFMGFTGDLIRDILSEGRAVAIYRGDIYDVTDYVKQGNQGVLRAPDGFQAAAGTNRKFMSDAIISLITQNPGKDITKQFDNLPLDADVLDRQRVCLRNLYFIGKVDHRNSPQCRFSQYILLALSLFMVAILGFKFLAALQFGRARKPEDHDKFVICQVPCYTEGEESMRKTINSLAALKYDDKRKLLFIICDGMIVGSGNDRPTPRIVLDILGADPNLEPEALSFLSLGEGSKQHNMAKIYSGLYEHSGHVVPYIVVAKCGKPTERSRPGNRGKRDSQLVLMRFLNKVHFGLPMNPMELEIYHQIKNVIGVNPSFYEYILQVDADTEVEVMSLNRFISAFIRDKKVIGLCGETALSNAKASIITMLQVYEYYISHYLAKAFESLFGSVTCLPGCFSMFRIRTPDTHRPLFIASQIVEDYAENRVDTLHTKNLLHLGEDRYLTTLVLKHFGKYKTIFVRDCKAYTVAPDDWKVLLSQRRRWINSTVHNLVELIFTPGLCGFCLFSMRFIVFIDLLSTIIAPVTVAYIVYLIVLVVTQNGTIPLTAIIMLAAIYGCQAIIFLLNRKFEMIGWMIIYILGIPIWSLFLPLYSFWHMDDFSWGNTRVVMGEKGQKVVVHEEGTFDPSEIPLQTWTDYENELWERNSARSIGSIIEAARAENKSLGSRAGSQYAPSLYGQPMLPNNGSFGHSPSPSFGGTPSHYGGYPAGPGSQMGGAGSGYFPQDAARQSTYSLAGMQGGYGQQPMSMYGLPAGSVYGMPAAGSGFMPQPFNTTASMYGYPQAGATQSIYGGSQLGYGGFPDQQHAQQQQAMPRASGSGGSQSPPREPVAAGLPSDTQIKQDIRSLIAEADLTTITKKQLRAKLEAKYGTSIESKKAFVNAEIERVLAES